MPRLHFERDTILYSLGACLAFLLTGSRPEAATCSHPRSLRPEVSEGLDTVVARATAVELTDRYATARELMADLSNAA